MSRAVACSWVSPASGIGVVPVRIVFQDQCAPVAQAFEFLSSSWLRYGLHVWRRRDVSNIYVQQYRVAAANARFPLLA